MTTDDADPAAETAAREVRELDSAALKALAHPLRVRILDLLSEHGAQTASSIAELVGESSGSTSYHLRALAKHDLIREVPGRGTARERWWERPRGSISLGGPRALESVAGRAASQIVLSEFYRQRHDSLMRYIEHAMGDEHPREDALLTTSTWRLTEEQFALVQRELEELVFRLGEEHGAKDAPDDARPYAFRLDLFPLGS